MTSIVFGAVPAEESQQTGTMAGSDRASAWPVAGRAGRVVVHDMPKFDLESYIGNYRGRTRFDRLMLIGLSSPPLAVDALKFAVREARNGCDPAQYEKAVEALLGTAPEGVVPDTKWLEMISKTNQLETAKLDGELRGYKNNLIKESIRMGYDDLGQHYQQTGDLTDASKAFAKMRDYCTTSAHLLIMSMRLIQVSVDQQNWLAVQSNAQRVRQNMETHTFPEGGKAKAKLSAAMGVSHLAMGQYREAAREFLETDPRMTQAKLDNSMDEESFNTVLTPNDVSTYGGLCAMASMDRQELQNKVLNHKTFRNYLELEPHIRRAITDFVSCKYSACLSILDSYKADYLLDPYLQKHVEEIYFLIRSKAIRQHFVPFSCASLASLAEAFNTDEASMTAEILRMIKSGGLPDARINAVDRTLVATKPDPHQKMLRDSLANADEYADTLHLHLVRMAAINAGLVVPDSKEGMGAAAASLMQAEGNAYDARAAAAAVGAGST